MDIDHIRTVAERILGLTLGEAQTLRGSDEAPIVLRYAVRGGPPSSVVVRRPGTWARYDPDQPGGSAWGLLNEWAGLQFLTDLGVAPPVAPRFYGADRHAGVVVYEDLGDGPSLADILLGDDPASAERALEGLASVLGQLHAATARQTSRWRILRDKLGPGGRPDRHDGVERTVIRFVNVLRGVGVSVTEACEGEMQDVVDALREPGPFLVYAHGDPCPDNNRVSPAGVQLFDFEVGGPRHALTDGVYGHVPFPTCWCTNRLPARIPEQMEDAYRHELGRGIPEADDDAIFDGAVATACAWWFMSTTSRDLADTLFGDTSWGVATHAQRVALRTATFQRVASERGAFSELATVARRLEQLLRAQPEDMPLYPAFRGTS